MNPTCRLSVRISQFDPDRTFCIIKKANERGPSCLTFWTTIRLLGDQNHEQFAVNTGNQDKANGAEVARLSELI